MNWIKCSERMPDEGVSVLVWQDYPPCCWTAHMEDDGEYQTWHEEGDGYQLGHITHWMPIPDPPQP
jgi:hypothetical protein